MGVTLHYRGRLRPRETARNFYLAVKLFCEDRKWPVSPLTEADGMQSFSVEPHEHCEPLHFRLAKDGAFADRCKTQFAPLEIHIGIAELFEAARIRLSELVVRDEGHYWETRSRERLEHAVTDCFEQMIRKKDEDPAYYGPVKDDDGRIADLVKE